jgi:hypothetical protein
MTVRAGSNPQRAVAQLARLWVDRAFQTSAIMHGTCFGYREPRSSLSLDPSIGLSSKRDFYTFRSVYEKWLPR